MAQTQRIVKVFCTQEEQAELSRTHDTIKSYDSFVLLRLASKEVARVSRAFPTEDITDQFRIELGARTIDTGRPRVVSGGATRSHGAYRGVAALSAKPHHHLIQFVGPIKESWIRRLRRLGAEPREPFNGLTYIVRATPAGLSRTKKMEGILTIEFFGSADLKNVPAAVRRAGARVVSVDEKAAIMTVDIGSARPAARKAVDAISAIHRGARGAQPGPEADVQRRGRRHHEHPPRDPSLVGVDRPGRDRCGLRHGARHGRRGHNPP